jgi:hypothetical protein
MPLLFIIVACLIIRIAEFKFYEELLGNIKLLTPVDAVVFAVLITLP